MKKPVLTNVTERKSKLTTWTARMLELKKRRRRKSSPPSEARAPGLVRQFLGWCVHGYTALGLVSAALIAV